MPSSEKWVGAVVRLALGASRDLVTAFRALRRAPGFSFTVIATLALCIGANTTIFSALYSLVLQDLPYAESGQLVQVYNSFANEGQGKRLVSVGQYLDYRDNADRFTGFAISQESSFTAGAETDPARVSGVRATPEYFSLLGVRPFLGRFYTLADCVQGKDNIVVLAQTFWETQYLADPNIIGKTVQLTGLPYTVVGVAPRSIESLNRTVVLFIPLAWRADARSPQMRFALTSAMYARVKSGHALTVGLAQLETIERRFRTESATAEMQRDLVRAGHQMRMGLVRAEQARPIETGLWLLQSAALFVLLLGCLNVASLMLARTNMRQRELAVRQALGAGRAALASHLLAESVLLGCAGAALGTGLAWASLRIVNRYTAAIVRQLPPVEMNGMVLGCTIGAAFAVALAIGAIPIARLWRTNLLGSLQGSSRGASSSGGTRSIGGLLVTAQVALALILLSGAGLLIHSFSRVMAIAPGFAAPQIIHARIALNASYKDVNLSHRTALEIMRRIREIPGVEATAITSHPTIHGGFNQVRFKPPGSPPGTVAEAEYFGVSPEFFDAMGIRLIEGRTFTAADDTPGARMAIIVDRNFAEKNFPGRSALGQELVASPPDRPHSTPFIIGVVDPAKFNGPDDQSGVPFIFGAVFQFQFNGFSMVVRTTRSLTEMQTLMRSAVSSVDASLPLYNVETLEMTFDKLLSNRRGVMWLLSAFAALALVLSAVGIYGMLAFDVAQRTREIGIRSAIGASRSQILSLILFQGLWRTGLGLAIGLAGACGLSRYLASLLFDVRPMDPLAFSAVSFLLALVALLASYIPARRATKVNPIIALQCD